MKSKSRTMVGLLGCAVALAGAGCDAQAGPGYPGEVLSAVQGLVTSDLPADQVRDAVVLANWGQFGAMFPSGGTVAELEGDFPAQFSLALYEPPPEEVLYNPAEEIEIGQQYPFDPAGDGRIALAHIVAVAKDENGEPDPIRVLGLSEGHALLYAEQDIEAGSYAAELFHGTAAAGYHLLEVREVDPADERAVLECEVAAADLTAWKACGLNSVLYLASPETEVTVRLAPEGDLQIPSYYPVFLSPGGEISPPSPECNPMDPMNPCG